jgi:hypothetical protein
MSQRKAKCAQRPLFRIRARHRKDRRNAVYTERFLNALFPDASDLFELTTRRSWISTVMEWGRTERYGWEFATPYMDHDDRANDFSPFPPEARDNAEG